MWVETSFVIEMFPPILLLKFKLYHQDRIIENIPSPFKYDGMTRTVLETVFGLVYYHIKRSSAIFVGNLAEKS